MSSPTVFRTSADVDYSGRSSDHIPFGEALAKMNALNEERRRAGRSSSRGSGRKMPLPLQQLRQKLQQQQRQQQQQLLQQKQQRFDSPSNLHKGGVYDEDDDTLPPNVPTSCHRTLLTLRLLSKEWMRARGHEKQLGAYIEAKVVPRGLRIKVDPGVNFDEQHRQLWSREIEKGSLELMTLLRDEHRLDSENLLAQITRLTHEMAKLVVDDSELLSNIMAWAAAGGKAIGRRMERISASKLDRDLKEYNRNQLAAMCARSALAGFSYRRGRSPSRRYKSRSAGGARSRSTSKNGYSGHDWGGVMSKSKNARSKSQNGRSKSQNGRSKSQNGRSKSNNGRSKSQNGRSKSQNGRSKSQNGRSKSQNGRSKSQNGRSKRQNGRSKSQNGRNKIQNGRSKSNNGKNKSKNKSGWSNSANQGKGQQQKNRKQQQQQQQQRRK